MCWEAQNRYPLKQDCPAPQQLVECFSLFVFNSLKQKHSFESVQQQNVFVKFILFICINGLPACNKKSLNLFVNILHEFFRFLKFVCETETEIY